MLKALTSQQSGGSQPPSGHQDPLVLIQQQLDEVRRLKTMVVWEPGEESATIASAVEWYEARLNSSTVTSSNVDVNSEALLGLWSPVILFGRCKKGRGILGHW